MASGSTSGGPSDAVVQLAQVEALLRHIGERGINSDRSTKAQEAIEALEGARVALLENEAILAKAESGQVVGGEEGGGSEIQRLIDEMNTNLARAIDCLPRGVD